MTAAAAVAAVAVFCGNFSLLMRDENKTHHRNEIKKLKIRLKLPHWLAKLWWWWWIKSEKEEKKLSISCCLSKLFFEVSAVCGEMKLKKKIFFIPIVVLFCGFVHSEIKKLTFCSNSPNCDGAAAAINRCNYGLSRNSFNLILQLRFTIFSPNNCGFMD